MMKWEDIVQASIAEGATTSVGARSSSGTAVPAIADYGSVETEYASLEKGPAIACRPDRALLEVTGGDRASWLHNLTTNQVNPLGQGEGNYTFVLSVQGRILLDQNLLVLADRIWLDMDRRYLDDAKSHFEKYTIVEDVTLTDRSDEFVRLSLVGSGVKEWMVKLDLPQVANLPLLGHCEVSMCGHSFRVVRTDYCGPFALEILVAADSVGEVWNQLTDSSSGLAFTPVGESAVEVRRIEAGIPRSGREITDAYLPAETGQLERAVSFNKGCYLGQEVVERMRSRRVVAKQLYGVMLQGDDVPQDGANVLTVENAPIGQLTSVCRSIGLGSKVALGYIKTSSISAKMPVKIETKAGFIDGTLLPLPFENPS